jgi:hypothetical protein
VWSWSSPWVSRRLEHRRAMTIERP